MVVKLHLSQSWNKHQETWQFLQDLANPQELRVEKKKGKTCYSAILVQNDLIKKDCIQ